MSARLTLSPLWCCAVSLACAATSSARAQELSLRPPGDGAPHAHDGYAGVKPGGDQVPAISAATKPGTTPATITWPGFETRPDGSSRVFLQSTAQLNTHAAMTSETLLVIDLGEVRIASRTNRYPLFTNFFNTPVTRVELKRAGKRTVLELTLRARVQPSISSEQAKSGYYFVYIDFPPGQYVAPVAIAPIDHGPPPPPRVETIDASANAQPEGSMDANAGMNASVNTQKPKAKAKAKARFGAALGN